MSVQLPNGLLGVRRADPAAVDAHGAPLPAVPGPVSALLPGKITESETGSWQLALDDDLWPVRTGDRIVDEQGREWVATTVRLIQTPPLTEEEAALGLDLDLAFVRVTGQQVTPVGTEPADGTLVGRLGSPV
jgi:hypothetical protein